MGKLLSRANLMVGGVAAKKGPLSSVFLAEDGSTFATDRNCIIVVEPSSADASEFGVAGVEPVECSSRGVAVPNALFGSVLRSVPTQPLRAVHRCAALTRCDSVVEFATTPDGIGGKKDYAPRARVPLPDVQNFMSGLSGERWACVSLKRLKKIVDAFDKMCGGDENQPVFLEGGEGTMLLRAQSYMTGQRIVGALTSVPVGEWLTQNKWERRLSGVGVMKTKEPHRKGRMVVQRRTEI